MITDEQLKDMIFERFRQTLPDDVPMVTERVMQNVVLKEMNKRTGMVFNNENEIQLLRVIESLKADGYVIEHNDKLKCYELTPQGLEWLRNN